MKLDKKTSCLKNKIFSDIGKGDILIWGARLRTEAANHQRAAKYKDAGQCRDSLNVDNRHALAKVFNGGRLGTCPIGQTHHVVERGQQKNEVKEGIRIDDAILFIPNHLLAVVLLFAPLFKTGLLCLSRAKPAAHQLAANVQETTALLLFFFIRVVWRLAKAQWAQGTRWRLYRRVSGHQNGNEHA